MNITLKGDVNLTTTGTVNLNAPNVNLGGSGGSPIARQGDTIQVVVSGTPYNGTITSGSTKNKST